MSVEVEKKAGLFDCRDAFAAVLEEMAGADERVCAVVNDSVSSTKTKGFRAKFPKRFINVGIAEQNMVGVSAGLANGGMIPFCCGASCFLTARSMEQVKVDLGYAKNNVKLCGMSSGMAYGELGPTHHSIEDLAWTRVIPNLMVVVPVDPVETRAAMRWAKEYAGPVFLRISRMPVPVLLPEDFVFEPGKAVVLRDGDDVTLMANGVLVSRALEAAERLAAQGVGARVLNMSSMTPMDREAVVKAAKETGGIVTAEEASIYGGLGGAVAEIVAEEHPTRVTRLGVPGVFAPTGSAEFLLEHFGLTAHGIADAAVALLAKRSAG
ncbi:MAG TPA: transketolase C-terminal domain-containing protein [Edaphobacter sp.]|jgi:transketolase|nr:transketolase C-terminal domain-containing protein [Edaphobacter sp.]